MANGRRMPLRPNAVNKVITPIMMREKELTETGRSRRIKKIMSKCRYLTPRAFLDMRHGYKGHLQDFDFMGCYVLENRTNGKYYVGQAKHVPNRVFAHLTGRGNGDVYADFRDGDDFMIYFVDIIGTPYHRLDDLERDLIAEYDAYDYGYNHNRGNL